MKIPFQRYLSRIASEMLESKGYRLIAEKRLYDWQRRPGVYFHTFRPGSLPEGAEEDLYPNHPRLLDLRRRYDRFSHSVTDPLVWNEGVVRADDLKFFRGHNAYVWQLRGLHMNPLSYALTAYYLQSVDKLGLFTQLDEDEYFGVFTFKVAGRVVSRDLLDSVNELNFLHRELAIGDWPRLNILDIGAGYGRLAHRAIRGMSNVGLYLCTDAVATSTFLAEYYLRFRGLDQRARAVPLDEIEQQLATTPIDLAVNIHSFSECRASAIDWWLTRLNRHSVRYLFVVPNAVESGGRLINHAGEDFGAIIECHGYRLRTVSPKYADPTVQEYGVASTYYHLFERA
jgi:SAM-dependent methyltransferase